jgi:hypothetical protein
MYSRYPRKVPACGDGIGTVLPSCGLYKSQDAYDYALQEPASSFLARFEELRYDTPTELSGVPMDAGIATQLITVGATLAGVMLTLAANAHLEHRRARDTRELESLRLASEHAKWLRDERVKAYGAFALASEETLQFIRSELPTLIGSNDAARRRIAQTRWADFRIEIRKAYNQVALFGTDDAREAARVVWRTARNGGNDFLRQFEVGADVTVDAPYSSVTLKDLASRLGILGNQFLEVCRDELQSRQIVPAAVRKAEAPLA